MNKKAGLLIAAAAAAYGIYKYNKMSAAEKDSLKAKAKGMMDKGMESLTGMFNSATNAVKEM
ncbi:MAG: hypothetical protein ABIX01_09245 [Chitinophagaceae bacterium]